MSATITWKVGTMECYPQYQQEKDVVFTEIGRAHV